MGTYIFMEHGVFVLKFLSLMEWESICHTSWYKETGGPVLAEESTEGNIL